MIYDPSGLRVMRGLGDEEVERLKSTYDAAIPYQHCVIDAVCDPERLRQVRQEIIENFDATYKETDLFKMLQTVDLANLDAMDEEKRGKIPSLVALRNDIYSEEFRRFVSHVTGCGELSDKTDCACNIHPMGGHLLCHDDVIGDRRVSYIIYLTDPDSEWKSEDGGALELYPEDPDSPLVPYTIPTAIALPLWNSMAMFKVQAGKSFHSIQEVFTSEKPRMSIQGWFHGGKSQQDEGALPTLSMLQAKVHEDDATKFEAFTKVYDGGEDMSMVSDEEFTLSEKDVEYLSPWINPMYLSPNAMPKIQKKFEEDGSVQLLNFLSDEVAGKIKTLMLQVDTLDLVGRGRMAPYTAGLSGGWKLQGPCHMQRFLRYDYQATSASKDTRSPHCELGRLMQDIYDKVFCSMPFCHLMRSFTTLTVLGRRGEIRRFRPGLDYTVAHYGALTKDPRMDVVLCFVDEKEADWGDGEVGGFEAYLLADDEDDGPAEVYRQVQDDDSGVLNVSPSFNSVSIVLRDEGLMRFVKYLSSSAPGSRWDISAVLLPEDDSDDEEG